MKMFLLILVFVIASPARSEAQAPDAPAAEGEAPITWVDDTHAYATDQTQALAEWMDSFFGDPNYDLESPESLVRVVWRNDFDQSDGYNTKVRLSGKLQLPKISKRLNLFFGGENGDDLSNDEEKSEDRAGMLYTIDQRWISVQWDSNPVYVSATRGNCTKTAAIVLHSRLNTRITRAFLPPVSSISTRP